jgi:DNA-binding NarL/FixJ family response regulator
VPAAPSCGSRSWPPSSDLTSTLTGQPSIGTADGPLRVIVADDDPFARRLITAALEHGGIIVIAEAKDGHEAVELAVYHRPDVILMDAIMPGLDGVLATRRIVKLLPDQLVVMLTSAGEEELGLLALQAGAVGFLSKDCDIEALPRALEGVRSGEAAISRAMTRRLIERFRKGARGHSGLRPVKGPLTSREWEIIDHLAPGQSPDQVANALVLSTETVRSVRAACGPGPRRPRGRDLEDSAAAVLNP